MCCMGRSSIFQMIQFVLNSSQNKSMEEQSEIQAEIIYLFH